MDFFIKKLTIYHRYIETNNIKTLEFHMTMKDSMYENIDKDEKETMTLLNGLMGDDPRYVYYWVGVAIKTLAMSPSK